MAAEEVPDLEAELARRKELKVQVPMDLYIKLHQNKIINGDLLSDVVAEALNEYLAEQLGGDEDGDETATG